jgi:protocadherin Fat 4
MLRKNCFNFDLYFRLSSRVEIIVNVVDMNDNPPRFEQKQYSASVLENASIGMDILDTQAFDLDVGDNGRLRYSIIAGDQRGDFMVGESSGILRVSKRLDYERQNSYTLTIQAEDSGLLKNYDTAEVSILLIDTNDNAPIFEHSPYTVHVLEEDLPLLSIFTVEARDRDGSAAYNDLEYNIRAGGQHDDFFHVNSSTGKVYIKSVLDREKLDRLTLEVIATDSGSPRLTGTGTLYVVVDDVNDHEPTFENELYEFAILENSAIGTLVSEVIALDPDDGDNSRVKYSIVGSDHFSINEDTGAITVDSELDREIQDLHDFKLIAQDSSSINPKTSSASVMIKILDENDNKPTFDSNSTDYFIPPGLKPGDFILGLFASDKDHGDNAKIQFSLTGKDANLFELNRLNGVMIASRNFADKVAYDITVTVSDSSLRQDARLSIYLAEELIVPSFDNGATPPEVNLDEDVKVGSNVVTFKASGNIAGEDVNYAIAGGNIGNAFDVDHTSGVVLVNKTLDYETNDKYELWIKTFYKTRPLFTAAKKISIVVSDKNDNPPHFETNLVKVSIPEGVYPPFVITEVYAFDADTGPNGDISYSLVDDNTGIFVVDDQTGLIRCTQELDREVLDRYTLKLEAVDNGSSKRLSSTATILLTVQDVNDNPPRFTRLYSINVTENTAIGTNLLKLETVDPDSPENANVSFKLVNNPDNAFAIHDTMGNISIVQNLDREIRDEYGLRVQASDGTWQLETVITVTIQDANDNPPTFDQDIYEFNHAGDQSKKVGRVHALDRDSLGPNSEVSYELTHDSDFFDVDESSGDIMAKKNLKLRTMIDSYQIRIIAKDAGSPPMSSECQVIINLVNSNLNAPKFRGEIGEIGIPSSIGVGTTILQLNATDKDDNDMTKLLFKLAQPNDYFEIDDTSMKVLKSLGSLRGSSLELNITVNDQGVPNLQDSKTVKITITDDNQYSPEFQSPTTRIYIREDEAIDNVIITVRATDQDHGVNGFLEYFIVKGDPEAMFKIDKTTGSISVAKILDYEKIPVYNIIVQAEDRGFYSRSGTSSVKIILQDVDDNPPTFDQDLYEAVLEENAPIGTVVTQMIANDLDSAKNADIVYDMIDKSETDRYFNIDSVTGIVRALATFDYEQFSHTDLKIRARNPTSKDQSPAITTLRIQIQGKNEFFPRFKQPVFQFAVSESAQDGALVGQVEAVDNDAGPDGTVFYYFVGSSNGAGFVIDRKTGVIRVQDELDRESQHRYVLTVLAKNQGSIHGNDTDEAQIIVQVQDGNDPPVFRRSFYRAHVSEDAPHGKFLTLDSQFN